MSGALGQFETAIARAHDAVEEALRDARGEVDAAVAEVTRREVAEIARALPREAIAALIDGPGSRQAPDEDEIGGPA
jgi:hypothetical protein